MSEQRDKAAGLEDRYVAEHEQTEELLEGLDPADTDEQAKDQVEAVAGGEQAADHVESMAREDP